MPTKDLRTAATTKPQSAAGSRTVVYRDTKGRSFDAVVVGAGSSSGLKIKLTSDNGRIIDNVAKATGLKQTNVYHAR